MTYRRANKRSTLACREMTSIVLRGARQSIGSEAARGAASSVTSRLVCYLTACLINHNNNRLCLLMLRHTPRHTEFTLFTYVVYFILLYAMFILEFPLSITQRHTPRYICICCDVEYIYIYTLHTTSHVTAYLASTSHLPRIYLASTSHLPQPALSQ